jgi:predicted  nucleic acid-binding Zn-ribbon protein
MRLFELPARENGAAELRPPEGVSKTVEHERKAILDEMAARQSAWFDDEMDKLDNWAEDRRAGLKADLKELDDQIKALKKEIRQTGNLPDKLALQRKARELETKRDEAWRAYDAAAKEIEVQKDGLLDQVESRLGQTVSDEELFAIRFEVK